MWNHLQNKPVRHILHTLSCLSQFGFQCSEDSLLGGPPQGSHRWRGCRGRGRELSPEALQPPGRGSWRCSPRCRCIGISLSSSSEANELIETKLLYWFQALHCWPEATQETGACGHWTGASVMVNWDPESLKADFMGNQMFCSNVLDWRWFAPKCVTPGVSARGHSNVYVMCVWCVCAPGKTFWSIMRLYLVLAAQRWSETFYRNHLFLLRHTRLGLLIFLGKIG